MSANLPYPNSPQNGDAPNADIVRANFQALIQAIQSYDGSQIQAGTVLEVALTAAINPRLRYDETGADFVVGGTGVWSLTGGLVGTMTQATIYMNGYRTVVPAIGSKTFTASKDTYVDIDYLGNVTYQEVVNNAASPALAAGSIRIAIVTTNGSAITNINQGQPNQVLPIASSVPYAVTDSLGNRICNRDPAGRILGYRQITAGVQTTSGTPAQVPGLSCPVIVPADRQVKATLFTAQLNDPGANNTIPLMGLWDGVVNVGTQVAQSQIGSLGTSSASRVGQTAIGFHGPSAGLHTYNAGYWSSGGTANIAASGAYPAFIMVELM